MTSTGHDVNALVELATTHADKWGDSCHHALAEEVVRLREEIASLKGCPDCASPTRHGWPCPTTQEDK